MRIDRSLVCINPILWIGLIHKCSIDSKSLITLWTKHDVTVTLGWQDSNDTEKSISGLFWIGYNRTRNVSWLRNQMRLDFMWIISACTSVFFPRNSRKISQILLSAAFILRFYVPVNSCGHVGTIRRMAVEIYYQSPGMYKGSDRDWTCDSGSAVRHVADCAMQPGHLWMML